MAGPRRGSGKGSAPPERTHEEQRAYAKERALRLLTVRPRSRSELADRLSRIGTDPEILDGVLADLERVGLVDDDAFARELIAARMGGRLEGDRAVRAALRAKGLDPHLVERSIAEAGGDEQARADELARARAPRLAALPPERAYARLLGLLQRRGHGYGVASSAVRRALSIDRPED
jgi:regulatory protein